MALSKLFIDSAAFIAIHSRHDGPHGPAIDFYRQLPKSTAIMTSVLVVSETYSWLRSRVGYYSASVFLDLIFDAVETRWMEVVYSDPDIDRRTRQVLRKYRDHELSYTDASSAVIMEMTGIKDVFTFDKHFVILGKRVHPGM